MDISEFLTPDPTISTSSSLDNDGAHQRFTDLQALTRAWINERGAPELLPYPASLLIRTSARLRAQITRIEDLTAAADPTAALTLILLQTDLERARFLLRAYARQRLAKLDAHPLHYLRRQQREGSPSGGLLSDIEIAYAERRWALLRAHFEATFLAAFPVGLTGLEDTQGGVSMVTAPDAEGGVVVRAVQDVDVDVKSREEDGTVRVHRGRVVVCRWADVRSAVIDGQLELV